MYQVRNNFRNNYQQTNVLCPLCERDEDTQEHLFKCRNIQEALLNDDSQQLLVYEDIFSNDTDTLLNVARKLKKIVDVREQAEDSRTTK